MRSATLFIAALIPLSCGLQLAARRVTAAQRVPLITASFDRPVNLGLPGVQLSLPPAAERNVVAEVLAAAEIATRRSGRAPEDRPAVSGTGAAGVETARKPLRLVSAIVGEALHQLIAEEIDQICTGKHQGKSWLRPLAMRVTENATLGVAQFHYDSSLGWFATKPDEAGALPADVHVFSPLVHAVFLPSTLVHPIDAGLSLTVRLLCDTHAAQMSFEDDESGAGFFSPPDGDQLRLRSFLSALSSL